MLQDMISRLSQTYRTEGNTPGCTPAIIRITPRQGKVKGNSLPPPQSPLSASKTGVSLEWRKIPLGFPQLLETPRGIPRTPKTLGTIQITPGIAQEVPRDLRSDPAKMWPRRFCATTPSGMPAHPAILRTNPGSNTPWQDNLIAIGTAPTPYKAHLPLGQQRCP